MTSQCSWLILSQISALRSISKSGGKGGSKRGHLDPLMTEMHHFPRARTTDELMIYTNLSKLYYLHGCSLATRWCCSPSDIILICWLKWRTENFRIQFLFSHIFHYLYFHLLLRVQVEFDHIVHTPNLTKAACVLPAREEKKASAFFQARLGLWGYRLFSNSGDKRDSQASVLVAALASIPAFSVDGYIAMALTRSTYTCWCLVPYSRSLVGFKRQRGTGTQVCESLTVIWGQQTTMDDTHVPSPDLSFLPGHLSSSFNPQVAQVSLIFLLSVGMGLQPGLSTAIMATWLGQGWAVPDPVRCNLESFAETVEKQALSSLMLVLNLGVCKNESVGNHLAIL
jgi:hypothetical protein